jgi:hypothetical protein
MDINERGDKIYDDAITGYGEKLSKERMAFLDASIFWINDLSI